VQKKQNLEDLNLLVVKNHLPLQFVENNWLKKYNMHLCPRIDFPSKKQFYHELLAILVEKTKQLYVLPALVKCDSTIASFDLWMSKVRHDFFHW
jgi:hypothetical protein